MDYNQFICQLALRVPKWKWYPKSVLIKRLTEGYYHLTYNTPFTKFFNKAVKEKVLQKKLTKEIAYSGNFIKPSKYSYRLI